MDASASWCDDVGWMNCINMMFLANFLDANVTKNGGHLLGRTFSEEAAGGHGAVHIAAGGRC